MGSDVSIPDGLLSSRSTSDTLDNTLEYDTDSSNSDDDSLERTAVTALSLMCKIIHGMNCKNQQHFFA